MTSDLAVVTMVRNDDAFLRIWIGWWSRFLPKENLHILVDGHDSSLAPDAEGCSVLRLPHRGLYPGFDRDRWDLLSRFASALTTRFRAVAVNDVDELLVLDPEKGSDPAAYLLATDRPVISPFAIEIVHRIDLEAALDPAHPILSQRRFGRINATYCKPCVTRVPIHWTVGGHYSDCPDLFLSPDLFLFHLKYVDRDRLISRQTGRTKAVMGHKDAAGGGWYTEASEMDDFLKSFIDRGAPEDDFAFAWQRERIKKSWAFDPDDGVWRHCKLHNRRTYRIPDRFAGLF